MPFECSGNGADHCCYVGGEPCVHLRTDVPGRKWACGLFVDLGSWDLVHSDPRYLESPKPVWEANGVTDCGDWFPTVNQCCLAGD